MKGIFLLGGLNLEYQESHPWESCVSVTRNWTSGLNLSWPCSILVFWMLLFGFLFWSLSFFLNFLYLFVYFGCAGSSWLPVGFLCRRGLSWLRCVGLFARWLLLWSPGSGHTGCSSCGSSGAYLPHSMWSLWPRFEPTSPALADGFLPVNHVFSFLKKNVPKFSCIVLLFTR